MFLVVSMPHLRVAGTFLKAGEVLAELEIL
jgi:hypothetical protein